MDIVNFVNIFLYIFIGALCIILFKKGLTAPAIILATLSVHGLLFNAFYIYRDITWVTCPPQCGLQEWSTALRMHGLLAIVTTMLYRAFVRL